MRTGPLLVKDRGLPSSALCPSTDSTSMIACRASQAKCHFGQEHLLTVIVALIPHKIGKFTRNLLSMMQLKRCSKPHHRICPWILLVRRVGCALPFAASLYWQGPCATLSTVQMILLLHEHFLSSKLLSRTTFLQLHLQIGHLGMVP